MLKIQRLNMDSSWFIEWQETKFILDPWLLGAEIDFFSWFNKQWHRTKALPIEELPEYDHVIISQSFSDHCHEETLLKLNPKSIYSHSKTKKRLKKSGIDQVKTIADFPSRTIIEKLSFSFLHNQNLTKASFSGLIIEQENEQILYLPHGFHFTQDQIKIIQQKNTILLITSLSNYELPFYLGGTVNPGLNSAMALNKLFDPDLILQTHDEEKHSKGLVKKFATTHYPDVQEISLALGNKFMAIEHYDSIQIK